ncbi:phosphodiesterase [Rhodobium gokarnense]|uniref:3',5'-cyclic AMP phosphodiesterase CpdA n=1 Tax=Rhodobium gokarnense TaxID=364296 RepID=A0ABT3HEU7_9HYPH|nr:phosphodiesterase [Rhodobium gokarnense]MCW2308921.1 3',5'-cyclic AMP phosphodiesterase CpdA [Rhodobium gokarnense]
MPMKLLHLTDIHLTTPGQTIAGRDPNANFQAAVDHALAHHPDAELMAITGDLSDWGDRADYERLRELIEGIPMPVALCIGNHDDRPTFLEVFPEYAGEGGFVQTVRETSAGRCLFLDTWGPQTHEGHYCAARQAWLEEQLAASERPVFLFMHHNPVPTHVAPLDEIRLKDDVAFRRIVARHRDKVRHVFHGHCHLPMAGSAGGVPVTSLRGTNHAGFANFAEMSLLTGSDLPPAYGVAFVADDYVTVHMVEFGYDGELWAENAPDYASWDRATMVR